MRNAYGEKFVNVTAELGDAALSGKERINLIGIVAAKVQVPAIRYA